MSLSETTPKTSTRLHIGCGSVIKKGWINHDMASLSGVDVVHDLRKFPWPFEDGQFEEIYMKAVLEHLPDTIRSMEEVYRITKPGAKVYIAVPYWNSCTAIGDPTHVRQFNEFTFDFFDPRTSSCKERPYYSSARFYIRRMGVWITPFVPFVRIPKLTRDYVIFNPIAMKFLLMLSNLFCNIVHAYEVHLERAE